METLSQHQCQVGSRVISSPADTDSAPAYEVFIHIIDFMFNQHAKWLKVCNHIPWRRPIGSLNYLSLEPHLAAGP